MVIDCSRHGVSFGLVRQPSEAQEDYACSCKSPPKDQFAEILVVRDQRCRQLCGLREHHVIRNAGFKLSNVDDVVAVRTEALHDRALYTLVTDQIQAASPGPG